MTRLLRALIGALIWTAMAGLAAYLYAPITSVVALACLGAFLGAALGARVGESSFRLSALYLGSFVAFALAALMVSALRDTDLASELLGPSKAYVFSACVKWLVQSFLLSLVLRASSCRRPYLVMLEASLMLALLARLLMGHREGHVNRPFFLVDPLWSRGYDPLPVLMAIGAGLAVLAVVLANSGGGRKGAFRDTVAAIALIGALFVVAPVRTLTNLPKPPGATSSGDAAGDLDQRYADSDKPDFNDRKRGGQNSPVALVLFDDDYQPPNETYYFRQKAYSLYNGKNLVVDRSGVFDRDIPDRYPTDKMTTILDPMPALEPQKVEMTVSMLSELSAPLGLVDAQEMSPAINPDPTRFRNAYHVVSLCPGENVYDIFTTASPGSKTWDEATRQHYLQVPDDPRYRELAAKIADDVREDYRDNPLVVAYVTKMWLNDNTIYCLKTKHAKAPDPVGDFLFGDRTGYCVYIAHAACYLYRAQGVPSRVVGGYMVPSANRGSGAALLIGGRYAHAWPEVYVEGAGWLPLDVNPKRTLEDPIPAPEESLQQLLGEMARKKGDPASLEGKPRVNLQQLARDGVRRLALATPWALLVMFVLLHALKARHRWLALHGPVERLAVLSYKGALQRLAEAGLVRQVGETRGEFARRVADRCPGFARLTHLHLEKTLGGGRVSGAAAELPGLYREVAEQISIGVSTPRRWLWAIDPISWWRAR